MLEVSMFSYYILPPILFYLFYCVLFSRAINFFSLNDLEEGKISFVHTGVPTTRLAFRVSDGQKVREF